MKYALWTAIIAAAAFAGAATAQGESLVPPPYVSPYFSNYLSPPGREACDWPQPCWYKLQTTPAVAVVTPPVVRARH